MNENQSPEQIYHELSRFIIGQTQAKRTMAVALRNRWRKQQLTKIEQAVIRPNHVLMVGPSGSGKTAIGKQLAKLSHSPFVKAEATQFTEVGYIGREVSEIVEDVVSEALSVLRINASKSSDQEGEGDPTEAEHLRGLVRRFDGELEEFSREADEYMLFYQQRYTQAQQLAQPKIKEVLSKLADLIELNDYMKALHEAVIQNKLDGFVFPEATPEERAKMEAQLETKALDKLDIYVPKVHRKPFSDSFNRELERMMNGCLGSVVKLREQADDKSIDLDKFRMAALKGQAHLVAQKRIKVGRLKQLWENSLIQDALSEIPHPTGDRKPYHEAVVSAALDDAGVILGDLLEGKDPAKPAQPSKTSRLSTLPPTNRNAVLYAEQHGIIFIDEIDKLIGKGTERSDATRAGVQRDLLPLLDGCIVKTGKYGPVDTSNMLFICSGAFQLNKPEELMVELQGRLPIRVLLEALSVEDFVNILRIKEENILTQYVSMMRTDGVDLVIEDEAVVAIAKAAFSLNLNQGNYGARRLYACVERALEDITYLSAPNERIKITITKEYIENHLGKH